MQEIGNENRDRAYAKSLGTAFFGQASTVIEIHRFLGACLKIQTNVHVCNALPNGRFNTWREIVAMKAMGISPAKRPFDNIRSVRK